MRQDEILQLNELLTTRGMYSSSQDLLHFGLHSNSAVELTVIWPDQSRQVVNVNKVNQRLLIEKQSADEMTESNLEQNLFFAEVIFSSLLNCTHQENDFDDYKIQVLLPHEMSHHGPAFCVKDLNNDGLEQIVLGGARGQRTSIFLQESTGQFDHQYLGEIQNSIFEDVDLAILDVNGDGFSDIYVASGGNSFAPRNANYLDRIYQNNGEGEWSRCEPLFQDC